MIFQCYFKPSQRPHLFPLPPYQPFGLEPEVNPQIAANCPELQRPEYRLHLLEFAAMLHLWRNPPGDEDDWIGFTSHRQLEKSPKTFTPGEIEAALGQSDVVAWRCMQLFPETVADHAERCHPGLMGFLTRMFADLKLGDIAIFEANHVGIFASYWAVRKVDFAAHMQWFYPAIDYCLRHLQSDPYLRSKPKASSYALERLFMVWCWQCGKRVNDLTVSRPPPQLEKANLAQVMAQAVKLHQAGNLAKAEQIYRQVLQVTPADANALHLLGLVAYQVGYHQAALTWIRKAVNVNPQVADFHANLAAVYVALGQWDEAVASCRQALSSQPDSVKAHYNLGHVLKQMGKFAEAEVSYREAQRLQPDNADVINSLGDALTLQRRWDEAVGCYREALRLRPNYPEAHNNLGNVLNQGGRFVEAEASYREALRLRPDYPEAHNNLGNVLNQEGRLVEAEASYRDALRLRPDFAMAHYNLGLPLEAQGRLEEALASYGEALRLRPDFPEAHDNLGNVLKQLGRLEEAEGCYREALRLLPDFANALNHLGAVLTDQGRIEEAKASYREALRLRPDFADAHYNLGMALAAQGKHDEALASYEQALQLRPDYAEALNGLAMVYQDQGRSDEAIALYRKAIAVKPEVKYLYSNLLFALHYPAAYDAEATFAEHLRWAGQCGASPARHRPLHPIERDPHRRLRVGYVSGDFREHVMGRYSAAMIAAHDRGQVEVFCYANVLHVDAVTQQIKASADHWRSVVGLPDTRVAGLILEDRIDLLVDLAGHTGGNRLGVFAKKPAPIQVTYFGYCDTTGLAAIDYRLTDAHCDPPGRTERFHSEKLVRLPEVQWCYVPWPGTEVASLPARGAGRVTFGSFNNLCKVTGEMIALWSQILRGLAGSRIVVVTGAGRAADERVRAAFVQHGLGEEQVMLVGRQPIDAYLRLYHGVDICLDTFPFTGCFTTADALWMGVPVVSLAGATWATRQGVAILAQVGLGDLVAETSADYVEVATRLARDLPRLHELRSQLRARLASSPLTDVKRFTRDLEAAYRAMWERFCREDTV